MFAQLNTVLLLSALSLANSGRTITYQYNSQSISNNNNNNIYIKTSSNFDPNCKINSYGIKTSDELLTAITKAKAGDVIKLDAIEYRGSFEASTDGGDRFITIQGTSECNKNTKIIGDLTIKANNWIVRDLVLQSSGTAVTLDNANDVQLDNLVINDARDAAVRSKNSNNVDLNSVVIENVGGNAITINGGNNLNLRSLVIGNVRGVGILIDGSSDGINILSTVARDIDAEAIRITGNAQNGVIRSLVVNGNSGKANSWVYIDGNDFAIESAIGTGRPKNGFVVNGCGFTFSSNMCNMFGSNGYCIYLVNKKPDCRNSIGWGNMAMGGRGTVN